MVLAALSFALQVWNSEVPSAVWLPAHALADICRSTSGGCSGARQKSNARSRHCIRDLGAFIRPMSKEQCLRARVLHVHVYLYPSRDHVLYWLICFSRYRGFTIMRLLWLQYDNYTSIGAFDPELNPDQGRLAWSLIIVFIASSGTVLSAIRSLNLAAKVSLSSFSRPNSFLMCFNCSISM